jgi:predicted MFS family arabinose efflux permease
VALLLIGAECMLGTLLFLRSPLADDGHPRDRPARRRAALASRPLRALLVPIALNGSALGATEVGLPALALHTGSRSATGLLLALWSFGSLSGGLMYGSLRWRAPLDVRYGALLAAAALSVAPLIFARSVAAGIPFAVLAGLAIAPVFSCQYALVGESILPGSETEAFTWVSAALVAGIAGGSAAGGALVSAAGFSAPFVFAFAITAVAAAAAFSMRLFGALRVGAVVCE